MKKVIQTSLLVFMASILTMPVFSCSIGNITCRPYFESMNNFNWADEKYGDMFNWKYDEKDSTPLSEGNTDETDISNKVLNGHVDDIWDYDNYNTGFQMRDYLNKQGTTGVPTSKAYSPDGNSASDFGVKSLAQTFTRKNLVNDWDKIGDEDIAYNTSSQKLAKRNFVAQIPSTNFQEGESFFNQYREHGVHQGTYNNNCVGLKNPFSNNISSFSYVNEYIDWQGMTNEGILELPSMDFVDANHKNGIPAYGMIFLDGWQNLTKKMMDKFLEKDASGNFMVSKILYDMCEKCGFDGFFINNEGNGSRPNGAIVDYKDIGELMQQFKDIVASHHKNYKIIWYRNGANVVCNANGSWYSPETIEMSKKAGEIQLNFGLSENANSQATFIKRYGDKWKQNLFNFYEFGQKINSIGNQDFRSYIYKNNNSRSSLDLDSYNPSNIMNGLSFFENDGSSKFGSGIEKNLLGKNPSEKDKAISWLQAQETTNLYSAYQYSGLNGYISSDDKGITSEVDLGASIQQLVANNPRIKSKLLNKFKDEKPNFLPRYTYNSNGYYPSSFGIGDIFLPQTTITDSTIPNDTPLSSSKEKEIKNDPTMSTCFSTGSGIMYINRDINKSKIEEEDYYPWTNIRLEDVMPTYQWDFWDSQKEEGNILKSEGNLDKYRSKITSDGQLSGYFDYYDPYEKGNSIAIANSYDFDNQGKLTPGKWGKGPYYFNLMGTNLQNSNYDVSFVVKATKEDQPKESTKDETKMNKIVNATNLSVTMSNSNIPNNIPIKSAVQLEDGWYRLTYNLKSTNANNSNRIAKLGLKIDPQNQDNFIFNVGKFAINKAQPLIFQPQSTITSVQNKYIVKRRKGDYNLNIRLGWDVVNDINIDYYTIYTYYDNKWYRIGETSQKLYYVHELKENSPNNLRMGIKIKYKNGTESKINTFNFNTKYS
ncbi:endo-beta-N-acetylglucosaminidase [Spiroplasma endosymbiont of Aspidapion aeneum]|uniref:endo-beta-N-acetylglucosaminidase n=1 Tax=Spiroplasma endosymbiont of Aspidapion aeneum TaxID=3066276 RepID=UPI00313E8F81